MKIIVIILIIFLVLGLLIYNHFIHLKNNVNEGFSLMDIYLKKRFDLVPTLVETVKGYAAYEQKTLENLVVARTQRAEAKTLAEQIKAENTISQALTSLLMISEAYPELKASEHFLELQKQLQQLEEDIANARKYYNGTVRQWNIACESFPSNFIANLFRFKPLPMYQAEEDERQKVQMNL